MKVAFVTYAAAPYRSKQFELFAKTSALDVYYISKKMVDRKWTIDTANNSYTETKLDVTLDTKIIGTLNKGLKNIVKSHDVIFIGGYSSLSYIVLSILCKIYQKPSVIIFDGVSPKKIDQTGGFFKNFFKKIVINNSSAVFGNGEVAKLFFKKNYNYQKPIIPQILTSDVSSIKKYENDKQSIRHLYRKKFDIGGDTTVLVYSGRLLDRKNILGIISAIKELPNLNIHLLILGGGSLEEEKKLQEKAAEENVQLTITGFISDQSLLFQMYYIGDIFVLASYDEPWGLVINEAMAAGLPVLASNECGASLDLVLENQNGFVFDADDTKGLAEKIEFVITKNLFQVFGDNSKKIIEDWTFEHSANNFNQVLSLFRKVN